jgi:hypothetical protein
MHIACRFYSGAVFYQQIKTAALSEDSRPGRFPPNSRRISTTAKWRSAAPFVENWYFAPVET